jgi:hypothetical protein
MDSARIESSGRREDQDRQSRSPKCQDRPTTSQEREAHYLRYSRSASCDFPSPSDTSHTTAPEIGQQGDPDHQQHDREQERQPNILHRMLDCMLSCIWSSLENSVSNVANRQYESYMQYHRLPHWESALYSWHEPEFESYSQRQERERQERERKERERKERERKERERKERERQVRREELLGVDLFTVKEERWIKFSNHLMEEYGDFDSTAIENQSKRKNLRFLGDILIQGGTSINVTDDERKNSLYTDLKTWVSEQWKEWDKNNK